MSGSTAGDLVTPQNDKSNRTSVVGEAVEYLTRKAVLAGVEADDGEQAREHKVAPKPYSPAKADIAKNISPSTRTTGRGVLIA